MYSMLERLNAKREAHEGGFTLIELLIVVIILGILAAIVVFSVTGLNNTAAQSACSTTAKTVDSAAEAYFAQNSAPVLDTTVAGQSALATLVTTGFLHSDSKFNAAAGDTVTLNGFTIKFAPGSAVAPVTAGNATGTYSASATACP